MNEAEALAMTYHDRLTVSRFVSRTDGGTGETKEEKTIVYESVPCALSQSKNEVPMREGVTFRKDAEHVLFTMPDIRMEPNDWAEVVTQAGDFYAGRTGKTFVYAGSHGETRMRTEGIA